MKRLALLCFLALGATASLAATAPKAESIAPGIWRIRLGEPEKLTPTHFRSAPFDPASLKTLRESSPLPLDLAQVVFRASARGCAVELPMDRNERLYGFGQTARLFEMTQNGTGNGGRHVFLRPTDHPENDLGESHAPVPFYVSTLGYGVLVDTARYASFYTGNVAPILGGENGAGGEAASSTAELYQARALRKKTMLVDVPAARGVDLYIFGGPTMQDAVQRYNLFSGGGCVPPLWGLGIMYRGFGKFSAAESLAIARQLREQHMPCDVWGLEPGWQSKAYSCSFVWDARRFPDPDAFIGQMRAMNFRLNAWQHAFTHPSSPAHDALLPWSGDYRVWAGLVPDFATAEARRIFLAQNETSLFGKGVEGVKLDECDHQPTSAAPWSFPEASTFPSGLDGEQMHSLIGVLYQQTMLEPYRQRGLRTWGLVRNSHALAASLPYTLYSDEYDHRCYVRGLAVQGFSGLLWGPEVRDSSSVEDFCRRLQTELFAAQTIVDCWYMKNPPWVNIDREKNNAGETMPDSAAVTARIRTLLQLRMRLVPYLYATFNDYRATGLPPLRALVMEWPDDAEARKVDDQFLCGPSLLVAPMFAGQPKRSVYLPSGEWYDYWTHKKFQGPLRLDVENPLDQIPLFVRANTLLPLADPVEWIGPNTTFAVTVRVFGERPADFTLYEDDGITTDFERGQQNRLALHWAAGRGTVARTGPYAGPARYDVRAWVSVK